MCPARAEPACSQTRERIFAQWVLKNQAQYIFTALFFAQQSMTDSDFCLICHIVSSCNKIKYILLISAIALFSHQMTFWWTCCQMPLIIIFAIFSWFFSPKSQVPPSVNTDFFKIISCNSTIQSKVLQWSSARWENCQIGSNQVRTWWRMAVTTDEMLDFNWKKSFHVASHRF